jgi:hypothetical protein
MALTSKVDDATEIPNVADRSITRSQLHGFSQFVQDLCENRIIIDRNLMKLNAAGEKVANSNNGKPFDYEHADPHLQSEINMYDVIDNVVKPMTKGPDVKNQFPQGCSYVETVATQPQPADFCISHSFGQSFASFKGSIEAYITRRNLPPSICFWMGCLAHRHWSTEKSKASPKLDSIHFICALQCPSVKGTLLITSKDGTAMQRIWCLFEMSRSIQKREHRFDIVVSAGSGETDAVICTTDPASSITKNMDFKIWERLLNIQVEQASATQYADKHFLMSLIPGPRDFNSIIKQRIAQPALAEVCSAGNVRGLEKILSIGVDVNFADPSSPEGSALHRAVTSDNLEAVRLLLENKADVNSQRNSNWQSPLHRAANKEIASVLLSAGADPNLEDASGKSAVVASEMQEKAVVVASTQPEGENQQQDQNEGDEVYPETFIPYDSLLSLLASTGDGLTKDKLKLSQPVSSTIRWKGVAKNRAIPF